MALLSVNKTKEAVQENSGGNSKYINKPGIYDVNVIAAFASAGNGKALAIDFCIDYEEQVQPLYGNLRIFNKDGKQNEIGVRTINKLLVILDLDELSDTIEGELPIGKAGALKDVAVVENLVDFDTKMWITIEYSVWNNSIKERKVIRNFYRAEDGASAEEIVNESEAGVQYKKDMEYLETSENQGYVYKDGLDAAKVQEWIKGGRKDGSVGATSSSSPKPSFAKKRFQVQ